MHPIARPGKVAASCPRAHCCLLLGKAPLAQGVPGAARFALHAVAQAACVQRAAQQRLRQHAAAHAALADEQHARGRARAVTLGRLLRPGRRAEGRVHKDVADAVQRVRGGLAQRASVLSPSGGLAQGAGLAEVS